MRMLIDNLIPHRCRFLRSTAVLAFLAGALMAPSLQAEMLDVRQEIARESASNLVEHVRSHGQMPPKHDWKKDRQSSLTPTEAPTPGGVGYGYDYYNTAMIWTNSTIADYYVVAPNYLIGYVSYLYLTSTCRAQLGTESLVEYDHNNEAQFWIYDWAQSGNRWVVMIDLPTANPKYLTTRPDEFAIPRQMIHVRNGTYYLGYAAGQYQWQNNVMLFNFTRSDWDVVYTYNYGTASLTNNLYASGTSSIGSWGPIVETFDVSYTTVNTVGFDLIRLFQDNNPTPLWFTPANTYVRKSSPWQLLTQASNTCFTVAINPTTNIVVTACGTLDVIANTNACSFAISPTAGTNSSNWVITPLGTSWEQTVVELTPRTYTITFNPVSGMATPASQQFTITSNTITMVQAQYYSLPVAGFTATPTNGLSPLSVTFTDTSTGNITNRFWNFGDGNTTNITTTTIAHTYAAGTSTVTLVVTGPYGISTNNKPNYIIGLTPPQLGVGPVSYDFGTIATGTTAQTTFIITNTGGATLAGTVTTTAPFAIVSGVSYTVAGFGSTNVTVRFAPVAAVTFSNNLIFVSNGGNATNLLAGAGYIVTMPYDSVGDGIPDAWRAQYFGGSGATTNADSCAIVDGDGDGMNNWQEYVAGTDPTNPASRLTIMNAGNTVIGDQVLVWPGVTDRIYSIERSTNLIESGFELIISNLPGMQPVNVYTDSFSAIRVFYRVKASRAP